MNKKWFIVGLIDGGVGDDDDGSRRRIVEDIIVRTDTISIAMHIVNYAQFLKQTHYNNVVGKLKHRLPLNLSNGAFKVVRAYAPVLWHVKPNKCVHVLFNETEQRNRKSE